MSEEQKRLEMLCNWLTRWMGKSMASSDDLSRQSAAMAYRHFVDLIAEEYKQDDVYAEHDLHVIFSNYGIDHGVDETEIYTEIYLNDRILRIEHRATCYKYPADDVFRSVEMNWRAAEIGNVIYEHPGAGRRSANSFKEVLEMFDCDEEQLELSRLRIRHETGSRMSMRRASTRSCSTTTCRRASTCSRATTRSRSSSSRSTTPLTTPAVRLVISP